ncbi:type II toxin-antitoxin system RelE/ParE family toxin [Parapedobacter indicus]|uniref:Plasmid stabilization system protein ParE n=1 Tax=Parapedobacter indicus TaxID=1477437 RepID=A0A1I3M1J0_9SPHI|nr:plasmid stabilization system protein ParE [Parapedobacter indicus]SFI90828.1 Plasmid stabilization system protein ParE [Parapedobacter indicus]
MRLIWTEDAMNDYHHNIDFLLERWTTRIAQEFIEQVEDILELIAIFPEMYPLSNYKSVRKVVIRKQISLFYKIDGENILLLRFWNNYQNPRKLKF